MYKLLITLILIAALAEIGIPLSDFMHCHSRRCLALVEARSRDILRIDWKPISVWPEEAARFSGRRVK